MELNGSTVIVTGAGSGIGRELSLEFARHGARVVCCGRTESKLHETVDLLKYEGGIGLAQKTDVTDWTQVREMVRQTLAVYKHIDVLFNNAGSFHCVGPVWEIDPGIWWRDVTINLYGSMLCAKAVLPHMMAQDTGVIINMDGGGGSNGPNPGGSGYGSSKAALLRFSESLARELEAVGSSVLVFSMMPGFVRTSMTEGLIAEPEKEKWQPHVRELMGSDAELSPGACTGATMSLLGIASPELNGRIFYVDFDYERIEKCKAEIERDNLYVMHLMTLDGRLGPWPVIAE
jgi:NAD(P)-dependent dehydrogenase (short-subunit alcohol dehydrogenase family)